MDEKGEQEGEQPIEAMEVDPLQKLTAEMQGFNIWVDMTFQVVHVVEKMELPFTVPVCYAKKHFVIFVDVDPLIDVITVWGSKTQNETYKARPSMGDHIALHRACHRMAVKQSAKDFVDNTGSVLLSHKTVPSKGDVLKFASMTGLIPECQKPDMQSTKAKSIEAATGGKAAAKHAKAASGAKAATKLPKASGGLVGAKAADGAVVAKAADGAVVAKAAAGAVVAMNPVEHARCVLKHAGILEWATKKYVKAVASARGGDAATVVSDKEAETGVDSATVVVKQHIVVAGGGGGGSKLLKAIRPSAGGGKAAVGGGGGGAAVVGKDVVVVHPTKRHSHERQTPDGRQ